MESNLSVPNRSVAVLLGTALVFLAAGAGAAAPALPSDLRSAAPTGVSWVPSRALALGVDLWSAGSRKEALEQFRLAASFYPTDPVAWHNFGVALFTDGKIQEALDAFAHERFVDPSSASALYGMGRCHLAAGKADVAENAFVMALLIAPRKWEYWAALAESLRLQEKKVEAAAAGRNAARLKAWPRRRPWSAARVRRAVLALDIPEPAPVYRQLTLSRRAGRLSLPPTPSHPRPQ